jgi:hypothetical protein
MSVNFVVNSNNGFCPNQDFNAGWNKPSFPFDNRQQGGNRQNFNRNEPSQGYCSHENLIACVELGRTLSRKVSIDAFLFKATKGS